MTIPASWPSTAAIETCRTAALGGHVERCEECAHMRVAYNSCHNRHCPKCQAAAAPQWLEDREAEFLPVPYCHVVFIQSAPSRSSTRPPSTPSCSGPSPTR
jgi:Transposase zinc-binding domain